MRFTLLLWSHDIGLGRTDPRRWKTPPYFMPVGDTWVLKLHSLESLPDDVAAYMCGQDETRRRRRLWEIEFRWQCQRRGVEPSYYDSDIPRTPQLFYQVPQPAPEVVWGAPNPLPAPQAPV